MPQSIVHKRPGSLSRRSHCPPLLPTTPQSHVRLQLQWTFRGGYAVTSAVASSGGNSACTTVVSRPSKMISSRFPLDVTDAPVYAAHSSAIPAAAQLKTRPARPMRQTDRVALPCRRSVRTRRRQLVPDKSAPTQQKEYAPFTPPGKVPICAASPDHLDVAAAETIADRSLARSSISFPVRRGGRPLGSTPLVGMGQSHLEGASQRAYGTHEDVFGVPEKARRNALRNGLSG
jgi:hypothetical protein